MLDEAELCGVLGLLTGLVGVPEGVVPLGLVVGEDGVVGPLDGELLGGPLGPPPEPPTPLMETIWPLGSKRTCAVHGPFGSPERSTRTCSEVWPPPASMPEVALRLSQGASGVALQLIGEVPEFQRVTSTSWGLFERCDTLMCSSPSAPGSCDGPDVWDGRGCIGPLNGRLLAGRAPRTTASSAGRRDHLGGHRVAVRHPAECTLPATGSAGPASGLELGRG